MGNYYSLDFVLHLIRTEFWSIEQSKKDFLHCILTITKLTEFSLLITYINKQKLIKNLKRFNLIQKCIMGVFTLIIFFQSFNCTFLLSH